MPGTRHNKHQVEDNLETRRAILQTAHQLFQELGYRGVSTRQIADLCGLTQPALYHHFANKQDLYVAVHRDALSNMHPGLERITKRNQDIDPCLQSVVRYLLANQSLATGMMFHDLAHELEEAARLEVRDLFRVNIVDPIASVFERAINKGILRNIHNGGVSPTTATYLLLSMIESTASTYDSTRTETERAELVVGVLLRGLERKDNMSDM